MIDCRGSGKQKKLYEGTGNGAVMKFEVWKSHGESIQLVPSLGHVDSYTKTTFGDILNTDELSECVQRRGGRKFSLGCPPKARKLGAWREQT